MIVRMIDIFAKAESIDAFIKVSLENHEGSIREPGVLRFDVLQDEKDPSHFVLYEVYRDQQATADHRETAHYKAWKQAMQTLMAKPRVGTAFRVLAPADPSSW